MEIVYHIGANCTDGERLIRSVIRNAGALLAHGTAVPGPGRYRLALRDALTGLEEGPLPPDIRETLLKTILDGVPRDRMILANATFLGLPARTFENGRLYGAAAERVLAQMALFPGDRLSLFLGLRNPATFVPAVYAQARAPSLAAFLRGADPLDIRWSDLVGRLRAAAPDAGLTVWMNEDTPLLWSEILRRITGLPESEALMGENDLLAAIMQPEGLKRMETYLETHPAPSELQRRRVISAFLDKYALPEAIEEELDLPGWTPGLIDRLTRLYEEDVARIAEMPGVTMLQP